jgi:hypothetical protein
MRKLLTVAEMSLRETARRRSVLIILAVLPLAFYLSRRGDHLGQSIRFVCLGVGWAIATAALFAGNAARGIEGRLSLSGYRPWQLYGGRLGALWLAGAMLGAPYLLLIRLDQERIDYGAVAVIMAMVVAVAPPFGLLLSALLPRELEGTLVLMTVVALQMMVDPESLAARLLPFWFTREIGTYAIDHTDPGYLHRGLLHATITVTAMVVIGALLAALRLRRHPRIRLA